MGIGLIVATADQQGQASWSRVCAKTSFDLQTMCGIVSWLEDPYHCFTAAISNAGCAICSFVTSDGRSLLVHRFFTFLYRVRSNAVCPNFRPAAACTAPITVSPSQPN